MANQRLYIRCKNCGQCICIARNYGGEYVSYGDNLLRLDDFFFDHFICTPIRFDSKDEYNGFELIDDYDDDFWNKYKAWEPENK